MTIVVTGAAGGVGAACGLALEAAGSRIGRIDLSSDDAGRIVQLDIRDSSKFKKALMDFEPLEGLVAAASLAPDHPDPEAILRTNFLATAHNAETYIDRAPIGSSVVLFSSVAAYRHAWPQHPVDGYAEGSSAEGVLAMAKQLTPRLSGYEAYCLSKHLILNITPVLARRAFAHGVRINCIVLGPTRTPALERVRRDDPTRWLKLAEESPLGIPVELDEVCALVTLLLSPKMRHMTGAILNLDGGWHCSHTSYRDPIGGSVT